MWTQAFDLFPTGGVRWKKSLLLCCGFCPASKLWDDLAAEDFNQRLRLNNNNKNFKWFHTHAVSPFAAATVYFLGGVGDFMNLGGVGDLTLRGGVGVGDLGGGDLGVGVGDLGIGVEAGVDAGVGLFKDGAGVWDLEGVGVGVLEWGAGDLGGIGVVAGVAAGVAILHCPSLGSGICSPCLYTLTVISTNSPPYLFRTLMLYLPESSGVTLLMTRLANLPPSNVTLMCSLEVTSCSFLNQVTSGVGSPHTVQVRLRD